MIGIALFASLLLAPLTPHAQEHAARSTLPVDHPVRAERFTAIPGVREFSGQLIVRPRQRTELRRLGVATHGAQELRAAASVELRGHEVVRHVPATDEYLLRVPAGSTEERLAGELMATGLFEYAEPDWILFPLSARAQDVVHSPASSAVRSRLERCPDDPQFAGQWYHREDRLDSCRAWWRGTGSPGTSVGVCDTGLRTTHEDLSLHRLEGYDAVDRLWESQGGSVTPVHFHGTRTTGVVAANGNNGVGITGVGWDLSHRMLRVSDQSDGGAQLSVLQHAARTSVESGDRVANVSYHGAHLSSNAATASYVKVRGGLLVWGAGNTATTYSSPDRDADDLIVVGATTEADLLWVDSSRGAFVDLVAPGAGILTTDRYGDADYVVASGTSYAAPMTSGVCAMLWDRRPNLSPNDVERLLKRNATDLGAPGVDDDFGHGRIHLRRALEDPGVEAPTAQLGAHPTSGGLPLTVAFRDLSTGIPSGWSWDFGDGSTSTEQNPTHTYTTPGAYTVTLTAANALGVDQTTVVDQVLVDVVPPIADFTATPTGGLAPLVVDFTDLSGGGTTATWLWDFGDGTTSNLQHPTHTYVASGFYTVSLTANNAYGTDQRVRTDLVAVDFVPPIADFHATPTSGASPLVVQFTDQSVGGAASSWSWTFGDGSGSSEQHPSHTYSYPGDYTVRLQVANAWGTDELLLAGHVSVGPGPPMVANFVGAPTSGTAPLTVTFTDLSIGDMSTWTWEFGDGTTSTARDPVHVYASPGTYGVSLQVDNAEGTDASLEREEYVTVQ